MKEFRAKISKTETEGGINRIAFERYFGYKMPSEMLSDLVNRDKKENIDLPASIENKAEDLMNKILKIDENEARKYKLKKFLSLMKNVKIKKDKNLKY